MERNITALIDAIKAEKVKKQVTTSTRAALMADLAATLAPLSAFVREELNKGQLAQAELDVSDAEMVIQLETNVVNLPMRYVDTIAKISATEKEASLNVYAVIESPVINVSQLRIDFIASADAFITDEATTDEALLNWTQVQLTTIETREAQAAEIDSGPAVTEKTATTKGTAKKTTAKKPAGKSTKKTTKK